MTQFTASEVRDAITWKYGDKSTRISAMLAAYADRLEADEKAEPVAWLASDGSGRVIDAKAKDAGTRAVATAAATSIYSIPLRTPTSPADAERLAEALRKIAREPVNPWPDPFAHSHEAFAYAIHATWCDVNRIAKEALAAHYAQAQPPAARVPDAMQELADKYHELLWAVARKFPGETRHETALRYIREAECQEAAPTAQKNPNG